MRRMLIMVVSADFFIYFPLMSKKFPSREGGLINILFTYTMIVNILLIKNGRYQLKSFVEFFMQIC